MPDQTIQAALPERVLIRLDTLIRLRWYAIIGQVGAVLVIAFGFNYPMQWALCLLLVALSAALNLFLAKRYRANHRLPGEGAFMLLAFDLLQLGNLLFLTGGLQNPFAILLIVPVVVSSTSLLRRHIVMLGFLAVGIVSLLAFFHLPLPWDTADPLRLPRLYVAGFWVALVCTLAFTAIYCFRVAQESRKLADALSATELILQREKHLNALDGLAAAAAHELGTPLATIALVSKEMHHELPVDSPLREDATLLREQAERCRQILQTLKSLNSEGAEMIERQSLAALVEETCAPLRNFGVTIDIIEEGEQPSPLMLRSPGVHYGLGNIIDNAVDFALQNVRVTTAWDKHSISITVDDDGRGFSPDVINRIGEPFITTRPKGRSTHDSGLGLGLFIAKTLIERSGASVTFKNRQAKGSENGGARVSIVWPREAFERGINS
ncbi:ActS/PrrB/RegB family redox-sensitive histidine kinase [Pseudahrensia aquimaris]|uniref:histidine kinase n=1 Tax=Pseudahrensia aquimaris TaxID=744461 RepID=A0ABW3FGC5_9HYPH